MALFLAHLISIIISMGEEPKTEVEKISGSHREVIILQYTIKNSK